jgi:hypothetical protein
VGGGMGNKILTTYLNDHLAGSVAALEMLDHLTRHHRGTELEQVFGSLRSEIEEDQNVLRRVLDQAGGKESRVRKAAAWLGEKLGQTKLDLDDPGDGELWMLEGLETLSLGIQGKLALWRALATVADRVRELQVLDFARLQQRATKQHERVEALRLQVARRALVR